MKLDACLYIMEITEEEFNCIDIFALKRKYKTLALKCHPDKGGNSEKFQKLNESYGILTQTKLSTIDDSKIEHNDLKKYIELFMYLLHDKDLRSYLYGKCLIIINNLKKHIHERFTKNLSNNKNEIIELNPSLNDVLINNLYKYNYDQTFFLIPLWHNEVHFEYEGKVIIFECNPNLPKNYYIDDDNTLHVVLEYDINSMIYEDYINIMVNNTEFKIPVKNLLIRKYQTYTVKEAGLSRINITDIYDTNIKKDIIFHINLIF
jgi:hypothetical protein